MGQDLNCCAVIMDEKGGNSKKCRLNEILLIEEINQLHSNGILLMFNVCT
jgi:hypothetical protein